MHPGLLGYPCSTNHTTTGNGTGTTGTGASTTGTTTTPGVASSVAVVQSFPSHECYLHRDSSGDGGGSTSGGDGDSGGDSKPVCLVIRPKSPLTNTNTSTSTSGGSGASTSGVSPLELVDQPGVLVLRPAQKIRVSITARYDTPLRLPYCTHSLHYYCEARHTRLFVL